MNLMILSFVVGSTLLCAGCQPNSQRMAEAFVNDGEVLIEALELQKAHAGTYPIQLPELRDSTLQQSKPSDWQYSFKGEHSYELSAEFQEGDKVQYAPVAMDGKMAGWYVEEKNKTARFYRSPKTRASTELRLENARVGTQKSIPTH